MNLHPLRPPYREEPDDWPGRGRYFDGFTESWAGPLAVAASAAALVNFYETEPFTELDIEFGVDTIVAQPVR